MPIHFLHPHRPLAGHKSLSGALRPAPRVHHTIQPNGSVNRLHSSIFSNGMHLPRLDVPSYFHFPNCGTFIVTVPPSKLTVLRPQTKSSAFARQPHTDALEHQHEPASLPDFVSLDTWLHHQPSPLFTVSMQAKRVLCSMTVLPLGLSSYFGRNVGDNDFWLKQPPM
jgi:hypothetical protein